MRAFLLIIFVAVALGRREKDDEGRPSRLDLGLVMDGAMDKDSGRGAVELLRGLVRHLSISPGTTRVAMYTVADKVSENWRFKTHVNREGVVDALEKLTFKQLDKSYEFQDMLRDTFDELRKQSLKVLDQRRIYLFISNSMDEMIYLKSSLQVKLSEEDVIGGVLISKYAYFTPQESTRFKTFTYHDKSHLLKIAQGLNISTDKSYGTCPTNKSHFVDECERRCRCTNGTTHDCRRLRREIMTLSVKERRRYFRAYKTLTGESPYKEFYEKYVYMHYKYFCWGIHRKELFLPWHRWFIATVEDLLRQIDCRVTLPFWDWSHVSDDPWNREGLWRSTDDGLGGNGKRKRGYCVQKGIFREQVHETPYWEDPMEIIIGAADQLDGEIEDQYSHLAYCVRRSFRGLSPSRLSVQRTLRIPARRFEDFDIQMRHNFHDRMHNIIGGTMSTHFAGDAPEFFLHHAFLDKIWNAWQKKSAAHRLVHFNKRNRTQMIGCKYTPRDYMDSRNLPRFTKITYAKFPKVRRAKRDIDQRDNDVIDDMARKTTEFWQPYLNKSWENKFPSCDRTKAEKQRAKQLHFKLDLGKSEY